MTDFRLVSDEAGVTERSFELTVDGAPVPGLIWAPSGSTQPGPAVLVGHGRTGHKRDVMVLWLVREFTSRGWTVVAVDAPGHGDRRSPAAAAAGEDWPRPDGGQAAREWRAVIHSLVDSGDLTATAVGYWGVSMGTALGISLLASEPLVRAAVLGLMHADWPAPPGERIRADAAGVTCPVLFLVNWHDSRAPRSRAFELYDLLKSTDKRLHAYPGEHGELPEEALAASAGFLGRYLSAAAS